MITTLRMFVRPLALALLAWLCVPGPLAGQGAPPGPERGPGTVTLPIADYDRLVDRAAQQPGAIAPPPIPAVIARAVISGRVDAGIARGTLRLEGEVFQRGSVKVPLAAGATLTEARIDGRILPLVHEGDLHSGILTGPGPFVVTLDWAATLETAPGRVALTLPQASAGTAAATLDLPGDPTDVNPEPGLVGERQSSGGRTVIKLTLTPSARTRVSWSVRETAAPQAAAEIRTLGEVKSLITIGEGDLRLSTLIDLIVLRGEPRTVDVQLPAGYELATVTGATLDRYERNGSVLAITLREPQRRRHQFLMVLEQPHATGSFKSDLVFPAVVGVQRESGEAAIEGTGTLEVTPVTDDSVRRMDVREMNPSLRALSRQPLLAAFRYQRRGGETRLLALDVKRFADAPVLPAIAEHGVATTLVTGEGRMLTEVMLWVRNRAQPFMKVALPAGASILSAEVAGEAARPVSGADGARVPLLRAGFRPDGPYPVSFVYLQGIPPLQKSGEAQITLATMDMPVNVLDWELFLPEQYSARTVGGNVIPVRQGRGREGAAAWAQPSRAQLSIVENGRAGEITGLVTDHLGQPLPGATVTIVAGGRRHAVIATSATGAYRSAGVPPGTVTVTSTLSGFSPGEHTFVFDGQARRLDFQMNVAALTETVTVAAESADFRDNRADRRADAVQQLPSQNIVNMQRKVAGVLPVRMDVPRAGTAYHFVRPLVLDDQTTVSFRYKRR
jgi:hypothetical protein